MQSESIVVTPSEINFWNEMQHKIVGEIFTSDLKENVYPHQSCTG